MWSVVVVGLGGSKSGQGVFLWSVRGLLVLGKEEEGCVGGLVT